MSSGDDLTEVLGQEDQPSAHLERCGPFRIERVLGEGGMGVVYLAEQVAPVRRSVALKVMHARLVEPEAQLRFAAERHALARLSHPSIARILEAGTTEDGRPYFAMELVDGASIIDYCDERRLNIRSRLELFGRVCEAVQHAHHKGILHRDLKPSNVIAHDGDGSAVVKVIDFGIAKAIDQPLVDAELTHTGTIGTPAYMSPEALDAESDVDTRADVYALGVMLYELVVGARPFAGKGALQIIQRISTEEVPAPATLWRRFDEDTQRETARTRGLDVVTLTRRLTSDLRWVLQKATAKDREERYGSPAELAADIRRYLTHRPLEARPPSAVYLIRKFLRRRRGLVGAVVFVIAALVAGVVARGLEAERAEREARAAREVADFMVDLFKVSDPGEARGNSITAREILDAGAQRVTRDLADQPQVQARLLDTIGTVYQELGLYEQAAPLLERALALQVERGSATDQARTRLNLGRVRQSAGDFDEAERLVREALASHRAELGQEHELLADNLGRLASILYDKGDFVASEELYREALAMRRRIYGALHQQVAAGANDLGMVLLERGNTDEAEALLREALEIYREVLPDDHPELGTVLDNLATMVGDRGATEAAEALFIEAEAIRRKALGDDHVDVAATLNNWGVLHIRNRDFDKAAPKLSEAAEIFRRNFGDAHPHTAIISHNAARAIHGSGDLDQAERMYVAALAAKKRAFGDSHPTVSATLYLLARLYLERDQPADAEKLLREALPICRKEMPDRMRTSMVEAALGAALMGRRHYPQAEQHLLAAYPAVVERSRAGSKELVDTLGWLVQLYRTTKEAEQSTKYEALLGEAEAAAKKE